MNEIGHVEEIHVFTAAALVERHVACNAPFEVGLHSSTGDVFSVGVLSYAALAVLLNDLESPIVRFHVASFECSATFLRNLRESPAASQLLH